MIFFDGDELIFRKANIAVIILVVIAVLIVILVGGLLYAWTKHRDSWIGMHNRMLQKQHKHARAMAMANPMMAPIVPMMPPQIPVMAEPRHEVYARPYHPGVLKAHENALADEYGDTDDGAPRRSRGFFGGWKSAYDNRRIRQHERRQSAGYTDPTQTQSGGYTDGYTATGHESYDQGGMIPYANPQPYGLRPGGYYQEPVWAGGQGMQGYNNVPGGQMMQQNYGEQGYDPSGQHGHQGQYDDQAGVYGQQGGHHRTWVERLRGR